MKKIYFLIFALVLNAFAAKAQVVISQIYASGGNAGATYTNDYVEIFNRGTTAQSLSGWTIQYASATGTWAASGQTSLISTTLQPGQYYLVQLASGGAVGVALPATPDVINSTVNIGASGKLVLVNSPTLVTGTNPTGSQIMDLVGYGTTPNGYEGTGPTGTALTATTAAYRNIGGCTDANNNATDFSVNVPAPRNTTTALAVCSSSPSLTIASPANATIFSPTTTSVSVTISVSNFTVANGTGSGHIHYSVDGGSLVMKYDTTPIALTGLTPGNHTVVVWLVDNSHVSISPAVSQTLNFSIATFTNVANITAMRADITINGYGKYYDLASNPVVSYKRTARNQKYVQDSNSAMLIDDFSGIITTTAVIGDALAGLKGQSFNFSGVLEFLPVANATVSSSGNTLIPVVATTTAIAANIDMYESKLCQVNSVVFTTANGTTPFLASVDVAINDGAVSIFRTQFTEADYLVAGSNIIPSGSLSVVCIVSENLGVAKITARNRADMSVLSDNQFNEISGLKVYPNPVSNGKLYISSDSNLKKTVSIYDVLGKEVIRQTVTNEIVNVSTLNAGIYILQVTEDNKTNTRKLVIE